jgi:hypothetical protein
VICTPSIIRIIKSKGMKQAGHMAPKRGDEKGL